MESQVQTSDAWIRARDRYVEDLNEEEQQRYFKASPESLLDDASAAEKSHGTKSSSRRIMEQLQPFVAAIEQYGEALDVYSSTYSLALGPIWGSVKVLLHIAREFGKYFDKLVEMFARIGDILPRFRTYERLFSNHERLIQALSVAYLDIIVFCTDAKAVFRRGKSKTTLKVTFKLLWKPFELQFGERLRAFRQHQKNVEKEAGLANMIEAADHRAMVLADQKQLEKRQREENRLRIIVMLQAVDYEAKHRKLQNLRHAGTGEWLFRQAEYVEWKTSNKSAFLCCRGIPGCGKSIIASNLIDNLISAVPAPATPASDLIYYYCDHADQRTLQLDRILGSVLKQLFLNHEIAEHVESQILQIYAGGTRSPTDKALSEIFCSVVALRPNICIVFDGLDECEKFVWQAILKIFKHLEATGQSTVKTFITCVEEGPVAHHLTYFPCVQVSPTATAEDIGAFVTSSISLKIENGDLRIRNPQTKHVVISELISKANGLFLWVYFQLDELCEACSDAEIRDILRNLPEGLGDTYKRILIKISQSVSKARLAQKMFKWAMVAKRPLHVEEFREAVAFEADDKSWSKDKIPDQDLMFECCKGLIIKDEDDQTVRFAHQTVQQYLTRGLSTEDKTLFNFSTAEAETFAGQICVTYLLFSDFETQVTPSPPKITLRNTGVLRPGGPLWIPSVLGITKPIFDLPYKLLQQNSSTPASEIDHAEHLNQRLAAKARIPIDLRAKYRLLPYIIDYWEIHTRWYPVSSTELYGPLWRLAIDKTLAFEFRPWGPNQHFGPHGCVGCPSPSTTDLSSRDLPHISMLHYAAEVGNLPLQLLVRIPNPRQNRNLWHYLHHERYHNETFLIACRHGRTEIAKCLMDYFPTDVADGRAVSAAATAGHAGVLQYLLDLDQYSVKQQGDAPLLLAAENGHEAVVRILAKAGANPDALDEQTGRTVMELAAMNGHDSVLRALIGRGARPPQVINPTTTALHLAAANGHVASTRILLESGFPADETVRNRRTALHEAVESGHTAVAEVLLEYGADPFAFNRPVFLVDDFDYDSRTPLELAVEDGHVKLLELKLEDRVDTGARTGYKTLSLATRHENPTILGLLLKNIREDQKHGNESKRYVQIVAAAEVLKRELEFYPEHIEELLASLS
ncbi:MAG: hypothetical protein ASARMPREDX12_007236 [Alectoria sarmentosa]|nr:MAG: hypothetical protein ASARMPREDX12_007236 [Alectoria sarmentosa]